MTFEVDTAGDSHDRGVASPTISRGQLLFTAGCSVQFQARLGFYSNFDSYVVSAFRRTSHGPAKAGHYVQIKSALAAL